MIVKPDFAYDDPAWRDAFIVELARRRGYAWDNEHAQYRSNWTGKLIQEATVRRAVERDHNAFLQRELQSIGQSLVDNKITLPQWQKQTAQAIKEAWVVNARIGTGGPLSPSERGRLGGRLNFQYRRLNLLAKEIEQGKITPAQLRMRLTMYANSARTSYYDGLTSAKETAGFVEESRHIDPGKKNCDTCIAEQAKGRQPVGTLAKPGTICDGLTNCGCTMRYYKKGE